ncbi:50S ribosomal protein L11 methyltransferase [Polyangium sp. y55x31]|uniref:50S ribosomal protein L11 methyltransferase n=1 Tax=Polyangium sp. y55x31 TaxID=3042688 RepID=UPI00248251DF|nr:50S ribosomal protein L11 methyltransferase [Polyangium sp. y55x31]MDI1475036.1 50S ribosomal protein L11 methyltransferase [Polyangium sp. y55x31]
MNELESPLRAALADKRVNRIDDLHVVTDRLDYPAIDQVFPLFAEQQFFLDELARDRIRGAEVLEIGLGSGVLSIGAARAGARRVTALEINPRAKIFAGFNAMMNGVADRIAIVDGDERLFLPVAGRRFDYVMSNPPFEPTPPGMQYFHHSAAGPYGLDFLEKLFVGLDAHLTDGGHAQIVTAAPGDAKTPTFLLDLVQKHLRGSTRIVQNPFTMTFDVIMDRLAGKNMGTVEQVDGLREMARRDGATHVHLCMIHYDLGPTCLKVEPSKKTYTDYWDLPAEEITLQSK